MSKSLEEYEKEFSLLREKFSNNQAYQKYLKISEKLNEIRKMLKKKNKQ